MKSGTNVIIAVALLSVGGIAAAGAFVGPKAPDFGPMDAVLPVDMGPGGWGGHGPGRHGPHGFRGGHHGGMMMILREADTNEDGALSQDEINAFIESKVDLGDANGDGGITLDEFEAIWLDMTRRPMVRTFQFFDEDGDAVISAEEIDERFGKVVARMDRNGDGTVSPADMRGRHEGRRGPRHGRDGGPGWRDHHRGSERSGAPEGSDGPDEDDAE